MDLDNEQRQHGDTSKNIRKQERRLKELTFQSEEDHKAQERMQEMIEKLQNKIKTYKRQVEEAVSVETYLHLKMKDSYYYYTILSTELPFPLLHYFSSWMLFCCLTRTRMKKNWFLLLQEEIAAVNLAKYRKVQHELEDAEERADAAENTLGKLRAKNRSSVSQTRSMPPPPPGPNGPTGPMVS